MNEIVTSKILGDPGLHRLVDLRLGLLRLHKVLLEMERVNYEKVHGQVNSGELLQLVLNHPQFNWLRMISALVVEIDEALDSDEPITASDVENLIRQVQLLFASPENEEFKTRYQGALQSEPDVVVAHSVVMQLLRKAD